MHRRGLSEFGGRTRSGSRAALVHRCLFQVVGDDATRISKEQEHPTAASGASAKQPASAVGLAATVGLLPVDPSPQAIDSAAAAAAAALVREAVPAQSVTATLQFLLM